MLTALGIIIFIIGCCISPFEDTSYRAERRDEERHRELMQALDKAKRINETPVTTKKVCRRFVMDDEGYLLGEEITGEEVEDYPLISRIGSLDSSSHSIIWEVTFSIFCFEFLPRMAHSQTVHTRQHCSW